MCKNCISLSFNEIVLPLIDLIVYYLSLKIASWISNSKYS